METYKKSSLLQIIKLIDYEVIKWILTLGIVHNELINFAQSISG